MRIPSRLPLLLALAFAMSWSPVLAQGQNRGPKPPRQFPNEVIVKFRPNARAADRIAARAQVNGQALRAFDFIRAEHWKLNGVSTEQAIARLRNHPLVEYAEPNFEYTTQLVPNDPQFPQMYALRNTGQTGGTPGADIKAVSAWDVFTGDPNLKIGVIDTGIDYNHPDLAANVWTNPGEIPGNNIDDDNNGFVDDVHGYDFFNNDGDPFDDNGHGTHVAGTIAAVGNNNVGITGVCWGAKIVGIKFLNAGGSGSTAGAISSVQYALTIGVRLTNNSWGGGAFSQALLDAINATGAAGQLFVAAAGNSSVNTDVSPSYPASYNTPYIIAVASTDHNDNLSSFSNWGPTSVDLAAPGSNILSLQPGNRYQLLSGTSMATPHVAGVVGLVMGRFPAMGNLQAKSLVLNAVDVKASLQGRVLTNGRLNAFLTIADPDETPPGQVSNLATTNPGSNTMGLQWTATGDDGNVGRASSYQIRYSTSPITQENFASATLVPGPDPQPAGSAESFEVGGLAFTTAYYFALKAFDEFGNAGPMSNVATGTTLGVPDIAATPGPFTANLLTGGTASQTLAISNVGQGTLDFTIPTPDLVFSQPIVHEHQPTEKGEDDIRIGFPVTESKGGPDGFGYRWIDSNEPGGPVFDWVDITGVGTQLALTGDDAITAPLPIGFSFPYYGTSHTTVRVCTNGFLSFTDASTAFSNQALPNAGAPANLVAPFWDDLNFGTTQRAYTYNDGTRFIVSWVGVPHFTAPGGPYTFQAILYPTGEIRYQYLSMGSPTNSATVGWQDGTKTIGLTVAFNTAYVANNLAVRIVPLPQWLSMTPTSGRVPAGESRNVSVNFNALGLFGGTYNGTINVLSNDPDGSPLTRAAQLTVTGAPDIAVSPTSFDFGTVFVGATPTQTMTVSNPGTDNLVVSNISSNHAFVSATPTAFTLAPRAAQNVTVRFAPTSPATVNATLTIHSNDPDEPAKNVAVAGTSIPAPAFSVSPESFAVNLLTNTATSRNLRVTNTGGSPYVFTAEAQALTPTGAVTVYGDADVVEVGKGEPDVQFGPQPLRAGGPDVFGYTYQDSDEPGGPVFSWTDIRGLPGTVQIAMTGDDSNTGPHPIGFDFPFYGSTFNTFRICTNGFVSFTSTLTTFLNTSLPNTGSSVPNNLLAVFWDDLHFDAVQRAFRRYDGTKLIIQFQDVRRFGESAITAPNTFQIQLFPDGTILYQYLDMRAVAKNSATIGIQNAARNDGLQVVFNALYVKNNLAIRFKPPAKFLTVTPTGGTVAPGGFLDLTVGFNAAGLFGGQYPGRVRLTGNDPILPVKDVPANLTVQGVPDIATSPASLDFGNVFIGFPQLRQLTVNNVGTDNLVVSDVQISAPAYGVDRTSFTVPPLGSALLNVSFNPSLSGSTPATLTIFSNDPDTPAKAVPLSGTGVVPPDIDTDLTPITATVPIPGTAARSLQVRNVGGSDLNFVVGTILTATSMAVHEELALGKEEPDPRPGILGSGGPDMFGYTWRDSDDPSGPAFDWVDITGIGFPIAITGDDQTVAGIPIGFSFPFYGSNFTTVNVCSNGWLSFTSTLTALTNQPLPNAGSGVPENLLAAFWDDLDPRPGNRVFGYRDGTRFIVSYVGVPRFSSGGPYTFQVILYPSGRIVYQYLDMQGTLLNDATIGIQNATRTDGLTVVHNAAYVRNNLAVEFRTIPDYLTVSPTSGTIPAGSFQNLDLNFNTAGLFGGTYPGSIRIASNDPDESVVLVPTSLTAVGVPDIAATPGSLDFGQLYEGQTRDLSVEVRNTGSDMLRIDGASISGVNEYVVMGGSYPIHLGRNGRTTLTVRFMPSTTWSPGQACSPPRTVARNLMIASNDPDGALAVPLTGVAVIPPEIEAAPAALKAALATTLGPTALTRTKTLTIQNLGCSDLSFSAAALSQLPAGAQSVGGEGEKGDDGSPGVMGSGGPDAFGYRWADSDDPQGPAFAWEDITGVGTPIPLNADDQNLGPFPLPFPFPFYGNTFHSFRICSNGWISFTSTLTTFTNTALPNAAASAPENLIAPFWDDLDFRPATGSGRAYMHYDGTKFIISYVNVPHFGATGVYTFQILLYPSGTIDYQYLSMSGLLNSATIGIQNAAKNIGLQVSFNAAYVKNNLRVRITSRPGWLSVSPASGVIPAGGSATLAVGFDANGLANGDYSGMLQIASNDLDEPTTTIPCDLHVGVKTAQVNIDPNTLNRSSNGNWVHGIVEVPQNLGAYPPDPIGIRVSSVLVQRSVPVAEGAPISYSDVDGDGLREANYKFSRSALQAILPVGPAVPIEVIGEVEDLSWFQGTDVIRVLKPRVTATSTGGSGSNTNVAGSVLELNWLDPEGATASHFDLWFSQDGGESWILQAGGITTRSHSWVVPAATTEAALLELVAVDGQGVMGSWISDLFSIVHGNVTGVEEQRPSSYGLRLAGANPAPGRARLELSLPHRGPVDVTVHDARGGLVQRLASGPFEPGRHFLEWDGRNAAGAAMGSGVYFARMTANGQSQTVRFAMMR